jgi:hypothetical protein
MPLFCNRTLERWQQELGAFIWGISYREYFLVFTPNVGVEHFWVDLDGRHVFVPTPSVGVVCNRTIQFIRAEV